MLKYIDNIKINFLIRKFKKTFIQNAYLFNKLDGIYSTKFNDSQSIFTDLDIEKENFENSQFDILSEIICENRNINIIRTILNLYYRIIRINKEYILTPKEFLSAWIISRFPKYIIQSGITEENIRVKLYSNNLIKHVKDIFKNNINFIRFNLDLIQYKVALKIFMNIDKINKINLYSAEWIGLEKSYQEISSSKKYDDDEKRVILSSINNDKKLIEKHMKILKSDFNYDNLKLFIKLANYSKNKVVQNYKNIIKTELDNKSYDILENIINEIKKFILIFNKSIESEINESLDVSYIVQLLRNDVITNKDINLIAEYIISKLKKLASIKTEQDIDEKFNIIKTKYNNNNNINTYISEILIYCMEIINTIRDEISSYDMLLKLQ